MDFFVKILVWGGGGLINGNGWYFFQKFGVIPQIKGLWYVLIQMLDQISVASVFSEENTFKSTGAANVGVL